MDRRRLARPWWMFGLGTMLGLLVGAGMMIGVLVSERSRGGFQLEFPTRSLHASATHGTTTMAVATGPIHSGVEGLFVLDFITGELQCSVLNPRTGQLGGLYKHNVVADLGVADKQPRYLMVTGAANFRYSAGGNIQPAESVVYVADANSGIYAAYMLPWNRTAQQYNFAQANRMILLGKGRARNIVIE